MQHIQTASVGHANNDFLHTKLCAALQNLLYGRDHRLSTIHAEPLGAGIFLMQIFFEFFSINKALIDRLLAALGKVSAVADSLNALLDPSLLCWILDMHKFHTDCAAICLA